MNLKEGMKVQVKSREELLAIKDVLPYITDRMLRRVGTTITVEHVIPYDSYYFKNNQYTLFYIKEDKCVWSDLMIEPVIELDINNDEFIKLLGRKV